MRDFLRAVRPLFAWFVYPCLLVTLASASGQVAEPTARPAKIPRVAGELFRKNCVECHGANGTGTPARRQSPDIPDFTSAAWQARRSNAQLLASLRDGKGADMPSWSGKFDDAQAQRLVAYVRAFSPTKKEPEEITPASFEEALHSLQDQYEKLHRESEDLAHPPPAPARRTEAKVPPVAEEAASSRTFLEKLLAWIGRFHPPAVNFPIALLATAALAELLKIGTGRPFFDAAARFCIWGGALSAVGAGLLGWCHAGVRLTDASWLLTTHRWLGTTATLSAGLLLLLSEWQRRPGTRLRFWYCLLLFGAAGLVMVTGFFGGALVFGLDHYAWPR